MMSSNSISEEIDQNLLKILKEESKSFKETHSFEERFIEYQIIRCNYPGFLPVYCELENYTGPKRISFRVYLSEEILIGHLRSFLKKLLQKKFPELSKSDNLYLMIEEDVIIKYDINLKEVYEKKSERDGWLYIKLSIES
jgi:hypothetical protein